MSSNNSDGIELNGFSTKKELPPPAYDGPNESSPHQYSQQYPPLQHPQLPYTHQPYSRQTYPQQHQQPPQSYNSQYNYNQHPSAAAVHPAPVGQGYYGSNSAITGPYGGNAPTNAPTNAPYNSEYMNPQLQPTYQGGGESLSHIPMSPQMLVQAPSHPVISVPPGSSVVVDGNAPVTIIAADDPPVPLPDSAEALKAAAYARHLKIIPSAAMIVRKDVSCECYSGCDHEYHATMCKCTSIACRHINAIPPASFETDSQWRFGNYDYAAVFCRYSVWSLLYILGLVANFGTYKQLFFGDFMSFFINFIFFSAFFQVVLSLFLSFFFMHTLFVTVIFGFFAALCVLGVVILVLLFSAGDGGGSGSCSSSDCGCDNCYCGDSCCLNRNSCRWGWSHCSPGCPGSRHTEDLTTRLDTYSTYLDKSVEYRVAYELGLVVPGAGLLPDPHKENRNVICCWRPCLSSMGSHDTCPCIYTDFMNPRY